MREELKQSHKLVLKVLLPVVTCDTLRRVPCEPHTLSGLKQTNSNISAG